MRVRNRTEVDSERQRQQFVAPPGVRGPRPRGGHAHRCEKSEMKLPAPTQRCTFPRWGGIAIGSYSSPIEKKRHLGATREDSL